MLRDADKPDSNGNGPAPALEVPLKIVSIPFSCPEGFEPAAFVLCAMDKHGKTFVNAPTNLPNLCIHMATKLLDFCAEVAVTWIQAKKAEESPIVLAKGNLPPFPGPAGRS